MSVRAEGAAVVAGVPLTHPDKVLYPEQGITKQDLAESPSGCCRMSPAVR